MESVMSEPFYDPKAGLYLAYVAGPIAVPDPSELREARTTRELMLEVVEEARNDPSLLHAAGVRHLPFKPMKEECQQLLADPMHDNCTWELCQPPVHEFARPLSYDERELAVLSGAEYASSIGCPTVLYGITGFAVVDPKDYVDDELMSVHVFKKTGLRTRWIPHRLDDYEPSRAGKRVYRKSPITCPYCKKVFKNRFAKADHYRRNKCARRSEA